MPQSRLIYAYLGTSAAASSATSRWAAAGHVFYVAMSALALVAVLLGMRLFDRATAVHG